MRHLLPLALLLAAAPVRAQFLEPTGAVYSLASVLSGEDAWGAAPTPAVSKAVPLLLATFSKTGATLSDDGSTLAHVVGENWASGATATPLAGPTWTVNGTPTVVTSTALFPNGFAATGRKGWSGFTDSVNFSLPAGNVLGTAPSGNFACDVTFRVTAATADQVPMSCGDGTNGWFIELGRTSSPYQVFTARGLTGGSANGTVQEAATVNRWCFGRSGSTLTSKLNLETQTASAISGSYSTPTGLAAYIGRYGGSGFPGSGITIYESKCDPVAATDAYCTALHQAGAGMITDSGHALTISRATTATDTVNGNSVTFAPKHLRINENGALFATSGDQATISPAGLLTFSHQRVVATVRPTFASGAAAANACVWSISGGSLCYLSASDKWALTIGDVTTTSAVQSFSANTAHTVTAKWKVGTAASVCVTVDADAEVCSGLGPAPLTWKPEESLYIGGTASTVSALRISSLEIDKYSDAADLSYIPGSPAIALDSNSIDGVGNSTITDGGFVGTWKQLALSPSCSLCTDASNSTAAEKPIARRGAIGSSWAVTFDGSFDNLTGLNGTDMQSITASGTFELFARLRRASSSDTSTQQSAHSHQTVASTAVTGPGWIWNLNASGAQSFTVNTSTTPAVSTSFAGSSHVGDSVWVHAYGDGTQVCLDDLSAAPTCTANTGTAFPGTFPTGNLSFPAYAIDGDLELFLAYPTTLTTAQRTLIKTYGDARWSRARPTMVAEFGDSITALINESWSSIPPPKQAELALGYGWQVANFGVSGQETPAILSRYTSDAQGKGYTYVRILAGVNDIKNGVTSEATTIANLTALADAARADGSKVILWTILPYKNFSSWDTTQQTHLDNVNAAIRSYVAAHPSDTRLVDGYARYGDANGSPFGEVGGDARALGTGCDTGTGHDGLHPSTTACIADMAAQDVAAVQSF
jgi:hypothetical protein